jgi:hypothetical protein
MELNQKLYQAEQEIQNLKQENERLAYGNSREQDAFK